MFHFRRRGGVGISDGGSVGGGSGAIGTKNVIGSPASTIFSTSAANAAAENDCSNVDYADDSTEQSVTYNDTIVNKQNDYFTATNSDRNDDDNNKIMTNSSCIFSYDTIGRILSIAVYLVSWVANGVYMQWICTGTIGNMDDFDDSGSGSNNTTNNDWIVTSQPLPYNKPAFLTWYAFCHWTLAWIPVIIYVAYYDQQPTNDQNKDLDDEKKSKKRKGIFSSWSSLVSVPTDYVRFNFVQNVRSFVFRVWSNNSVHGFRSSCWKCLGFNYALIFLNVLWLVGLTNQISVAMSNAIYQFQIPATLWLSMYYDNHRRRRYRRRDEALQMNTTESDAIQRGEINQQSTRRRSYDLIERKDDYNDGTIKSQENMSHSADFHGDTKKVIEDDQRRVMVGTMISCIGIGLIVIPPLLQTSEQTISYNTLQMQSEQTSLSLSSLSFSNTEQGSVVVNSSTGDTEIVTTTNTTTNSSIIVGVIVTFLSAMISSIYQVAWKILMDEKDDDLRSYDKNDESEKKNDGDSDDMGNDDEEQGGKSSLEIPRTASITVRTDDKNDRNTSIRSVVAKQQGLINSFITLGIMGICNVCFGWPMLIILHWLGIERIELSPLPQLWKVVTINSVIEFIFDASCAVAIYMTSPVLTSVVAPLTIPMSFLWEITHVPSGLQQTGSTTNEQIPTIIVGSILILAGVVWMEMKAQVRH